MRECMHRITDYSLERRLSKQVREIIEPNRDLQTYLSEQVAEILTEDAVDMRNMARVENIDAQGSCSKENIAEAQFAVMNSNKKDIQLEEFDKQKREEDRLRKKAEAKEKKEKAREERKCRRAERRSELREIRRNIVRMALTPKSDLSKVIVDKKLRTETVILNQMIRWHLVIDSVAFAYGILFGTFEYWLRLGALVVLQILIIAGVMVVIDYLRTLEHKEIKDGGEK